MTKIISLTALLLVYVAGINLANAGASGHAGHGGGSSGGGSNCVKPHFSKALPANLASVVPGAEFSFIVSNVQKSEQIEATVKGQAVPLTFDDKEAFLLVKGKLPAELKNTVARISIKVASPVARCDGEMGWLVKIAE